MISLLNNQQSSLADAIYAGLLNSARARIAVAFVKYTGISIIENALQQALSNRAQIDFVVGLDFHTTDALSLEWMYKKSCADKNFSFCCYSDPSDQAKTFHPKMYLFEKDNQLTAIIGSSNLTQGGLRSNIEMNLSIDLDLESETTQSLLDTYLDIKYQSTCFIPDEAYIAAYNEITSHIKQQEIRSNSSRRVVKALESLRAREKTLPKSIVSPSTLSGWQKLIFDMLPENEFTTNALYASVNKFKETYPENQNIEAKIRQVLQQLRDRGLLVHTGPGKWIKRLNFHA